MYCVYCKRKNDDNAKVCEKCGVELLPIVQLESLNYETMNSAYAEDLKGVKVGFTYKGELKRLISCIENGDCSYYPVRIEGWYTITSSNIEDTVHSSDTYYKVQTLNKNPLAYDIEIANYCNYSPAVMEHSYILRRKIKNKYKYMLVPSTETSYMIENIKGLLLSSANKIRKRDTADLFDKGLQKLGSLFRKNK